MKSSDSNYLTESYVIGQSDPRWQELDRMAFLAKNLFNVANYIIRQAFFADHKHEIEHDRKVRTWVRMLSFIPINISTKSALSYNQNSPSVNTPVIVYNDCIAHGHGVSK
ncbi:MAG: hypothetical protein ACPG7F_03190, partial [Aggregatilineales bacterium]